MTTTSARTNEHRGKVRVEEGGKRVRAVLGGEVVADTTRPVLVWEVPYYPAYYIPLADVRAELRPDGGTVHSPSRGDARTFTVVAGGREAQGGAWRYEDSPIAALRGLVRFDWPAMDAWFEEDEEVFTHPRDPYTRVDILASSRHVRIEVGGATVAESTSPRLLFETGLPVRYYLPREDVRLDALKPSATTSYCAYKGEATYWSHGGEDVAWTYEQPLREAEPVRDLVCFWNERTDVEVDGEPQERPESPWA
jgi:uncharacterized protein (DUF427 family)